MADKILAFLCIVALNEATRTPPKIPESFSTMAEVIELDSGNISDGMSFMYQQANKKFLFQIYMFKNNSKNNPVEASLERYDLGKAYDIECFKLSVASLNCSNCKESPIEQNDNDQRAGFWMWVNETSYIGQRESLNAIVDLWQIMFPDPYVSITWTLGVLPQDYSSPKLFEIIVDTGHASQMYNMTFYFQSFDPSMPPDSVFDVPKSCNNQTVAGESIVFSQNSEYWKYLPSYYHNYKRQ